MCLRPGASDRSRRIDPLPLEQWKQYLHMNDVSLLSYGNEFSDTTPDTQALASFHFSNNGVSFASGFASEPHYVYESPPQTFFMSTDTYPSSSRLPTSVSVPGSQNAGPPFPPIRPLDSRHLHHLHGTPGSHHVTASRVDGDFSIPRPSYAPDTESHMRGERHSRSYTARQKGPGTLSSASKYYDKVTAEIENIGDALTDAGVSIPVRMKTSRRHHILLQAREFIRLHTPKSSSNYDTPCASHSSE
ncbi:hypothetical protein SISSUDRAFT_137964 [Sistotremastrum suecicum HHB10207 ss-3]|uniref:Uncharacterized protein n=1 Tax=Sistotremastrum suecicum HHB10207 ss-3 TaxID=1314776 RepID=A0A166AUP6_9AGAM|nr:hypothetical protein SISSUDRAFT_137964 [Sistotremastrum suecicum HHB10207 ss-3]